MGQPILFFLYLAMGASHSDTTDKSKTEKEPKTKKKEGDSSLLLELLKFFGVGATGTAAFTAKCMADSKDDFNKTFNYTFTPSLITDD